MTSAELFDQSPIKLVKSFNPTNYPVSFIIDFDMDGFYHTPKADELYRSQPLWPYDGSMSYRNLKNMLRNYETPQRMALKEQSFREHFQSMGIVDYCMFTRNNQVSFYFKTGDDLMRAVGGIIPEQLFEFEFLSYPDDVPDDYLKKVAKKLQDVYNKIDLAQARLTDRISLRPDPQEHCIKARAKAVDIPVVMEQAKKFEVALNL